MSGHTPGPWGFNRSIRGCRDIGPKKGAHAQGQYQPVATTVGMTDDEDFANALLIAAAPDLLEACEGLVAAIRQGQALAGADGSMSLPLQRALEATAKARGGTR